MLNHLWSHLLLNSVGVSSTVTVEILLIIVTVKLPLIIDISRALSLLWIAKLSRIKLHYRAEFIRNFRVFCSTILFGCFCFVLVLLLLLLLLLFLSLYARARARACVCFAFCFVLFCFPPFHFVFCFVSFVFAFALNCVPFSENL